MVVERVHEGIEILRRKIIFAVIGTVVALSAVAAMGAGQQSAVVNPDSREVNPIAWG